MRIGWRHVGHSLLTRMEVRIQPSQNTWPHLVRTGALSASQQIGQRSSRSVAVAEFLVICGQGVPRVTIVAVARKITSSKLNTSGVEARELCPANCVQWTVPGAR